MISVALLLYASYAILWLLVIGLAVSILRVQSSLNTLAWELDRRASQGPELGAIAPKLGGKNLSDGKDILVANELSSPRPTILWFMAAACQPCRTVRPIVNALANEYGNRIITVMTCVGAPSAVQFFGEDLDPLIMQIADPDRANAKRWRIFSTPFAVIVDETNVVRKKLARISLDQVELALDEVLTHAVDELAKTGTRGKVPIGRTEWNASRLT